MAWTAPYTPIPGDVMTASIWATQVRDNFLELRQGGLAISGQATNRVPYASSSSQLATSGNLLFSGTALVIAGSSAPLNVSTSAIGLNSTTSVARGGGMNYVQFNDPTGAKGYLGYTAASDLFAVLNSMNAAMAFYTNNLEVMRLHPSLGVSIGDATDPGAGGFRCGTTQNFNWQSKTGSTVYQAPSDGFVVALHTQDPFTAAMGITGKTDSSNPPTTIRSQKYAIVSEPVSAMFPVKKGDYWNVDFGAGSADSLWWVPLGFNG